MYYTATVLLISIIFGVTDGVNQTVNDGASTSALPHHQLTNAERREINTYVDNLLNTIADTRHRSVNLNPNDFHSDLYTSQMVSFSLIGNYLRYGANNGELLANYEERRQYFDLSLRRETLETLIDSCTRHFNKLSRNVMNVFSKTTLDNASTISTEENLFAQKQNLTNIVKEKLPDDNISADSDKLDEVEENQRLVISHYNIIPLALLLRFFEEWSESFEMIPKLKQCAQTTNVAFIHEFLSNQTVETGQNTSKLENENIGRFLSNYTNLDDMRDHVLSFDMSGNYFYGPENRGPSLPRFDQTDFEIMLAFEFDCAPIVGEEHYE